MIDNFFIEKTRYNTPKESTILNKMADYGISWAEIDTALANEEFF